MLFEVTSFSAPSVIDRVGGFCISLTLRHTIWSMRVCVGVPERTRLGSKSWQGCIANAMADDLHFRLGVSRL